MNRFAEQPLAPAGSIPFAPGQQMPSNIDPPKL